MSPLALSVLLSLVSAVCYAAAAIVQERIATTTAPSRLGLLGSGRWWLAVVLQGAGALLHVVALGLGPLTVVQPLGVLTLVLAAPMAALLVKRPVSAAGWRGIVLVSVGLAGILLLTGSDGSGSLDGEQQVALAVIVLAAVAGLAVAGRAVLRLTRGGGRGPALRSVSLALAAGIAYGAASVFVKTVTDEWDTSSPVAVVPLLVLIGVLATAGLATSQSSYRGGGLAAPLATATVANPVVAAVAGIALLGEGFRYGVAGSLTAAAAGAVAAYGLVILAADSARQRRALLAAGAPEGAAGVVVTGAAAVATGTPGVPDAPGAPGTPAAVRADVPRGRRADGTTGAAANGTTGGSADGAPKPVLIPGPQTAQAPATDPAPEPPGPEPGHKPAAPERAAAPPPEPKSSAGTAAAVPPTAVTSGPVAAAGPAARTASEHARALLAALAPPADARHGHCSSSHH